jgi:hypothetical protein
MRIYRCLIVSTPKNYTMYTNKRAVVSMESCTSIYCTWCCTYNDGPMVFGIGSEIMWRPGTRPYSGERRYRTYRPCLFEDTSGRISTNVDERRRWIGPGLLGERYSCQLSQPRYAMEDTPRLKDVRRRGRVETDHLRTSTRY